jgi:hypothetical protein
MMVVWKNARPTLRGGHPAQGRALAYGIVYWLLKERR